MGSHNEKKFNLIAIWAIINIIKNEMPQIFCEIYLKFN